MELSQALELAASGLRARVDRERGALIGSQCAACGAAVWPARAVCYRCGGAQLREQSFASTGTLITYTVVWVERPGLVPPYTLGQIKLENGPLVFGHVRRLGGRASVQVPVRLVLADDETSVPWFWFEPEEVE